MPPKFQKIEAFNYGRQIGQMQVILQVIVQKLANEEQLCNDAKELLPKLEKLKLTFQAKCLKRTANFEEDKDNVKIMDAEIKHLLDEMEKLNIKFFD